LGADGTAVSTIVGWKQAPAFICVETQQKTIFDRFVRTLVSALAVAPPAAQAGEYAVRAGTNAAAHGPSGMARLAADFRPLGLVPTRALRTLPDTWIAEMPAETARLLALQGYEVQPLPLLHLDADEAPWPLDRSNQRALPLDRDTTRAYTGKGVQIFI